MKKPYQVFYDGNFWGHHGKDHAGEEMKLNREFQWAGHYWLIPSIYLCGKGIVVDLCRRVALSDISAFMEKWVPEGKDVSWERFSREEQMELERENPLILDFFSELEVNGRTLQREHGCGICFNPCLGKEMDDDSEIQNVLRHYQLDTAYGWVVSREAFSWEGRYKSQIHSMSIRLKEEPKELCGPHFKVRSPGDIFSFVHPVSGIKYTLIAKAFEQHTLPDSVWESKSKQLPVHFTAMDYTLEPKTAEQISIYDCAVSDSADGPISVFLAGRLPSEDVLTAYSSLHLEAVQEDIEWFIVFQDKIHPEGEFTLI